MADSDQERTEQATPKRRQEARKKGRIVKSQDLVAGGCLLLSTLLLSLSFENNGEYALELVRSSLSQDFALQTDAVSFSAYFVSRIMQAFSKLLFFLFAIVGASVGLNVLQTGFVFIPTNIAPKLERINPSKNFSKVFSLDTLVQIIFGFIKFFILAGVATLLIRSNFETLLSLSNGSLPQIILFACGFFKRFIYSLCGTLLAIGVLDYALKRLKFERELRMTQQEVRDELKEEGGGRRARGPRQAFGRDNSGSVSAVSAPNPPVAPSRYQENAHNPKEGQKR